MLMLHNNGQLQMNTAKVKGPPPVPPRPNQSVVAEALARTRKSVVESKVNVTKSNIPKEIPKKAKTLERTCSIERTSASPKQNGLARVKSFIRDVISDRSSSSDDRRSSGQNSRRSSSDSSSIPISAKRSNESLNKTVKSCKQILVRSLSSSNKLEQDTSQSKVTKSSSFADKTVLIRKAPPPPLSPKPKLRPLRPLPLKQQSFNSKNSSKQSPELTPYVLPIDVQKPKNDYSQNDAPYATVEEFREFDNRLNPESANKNSETEKQVHKEESKCEPHNIEKRNSLERKTSRVTELLISEILASRQNKELTNDVFDKGKHNEDTASTHFELEPIKKDLNNHEILIYELQSMRSESNVPESLDTKELTDNDKCDSESSEPNYALSSESGGSTDDGGDQAYAYILDDDLKSRLRKQFRAISTMSLQGLPPLPKSLSGFADAVDSDPSDSSSSDASSDKPPTDLDGQLAYLKKEMASLRQLDLSLLSELWTLSEAMASWRRQLERGPRLRPAPPPPPPPAHYLRT